VHGGPEGVLIDVEMAPLPFAQRAGAVTAGHGQEEHDSLMNGGPARLLLHQRHPSLQQHADGGIWENAATLVGSTSVHGRSGDAWEPRPGMWLRIQGFHIASNAAGGRGPLILPLRVDQIR